MYCDGPCTGWQHFMYSALFSLAMLIPVLVTYGVYRIVRRNRRKRDGPPNQGA